MKNGTFGSMPTYGELERIKELEFDGTIEKSDREKAIEWYNSFNDDEKMNLCRIYFSWRSVSGISVIKSLTGREIEQIWKKRNAISRIFRDKERQ